MILSGSIISITSSILASVNGYSAANTAVYNKLTAARTSPSAVLERTLSPPLSISMCSLLHIYCKRFYISSSVGFYSVITQHLDYKGSITLLTKLHANIKRVESPYSSIIRRNVIYACDVIESHSSKKTILCLPSGNVICSYANVFTLSFISYILRSSDAFNSINARLYYSSSI